MHLSASFLEPFKTCSWMKRFSALFMSEIFKEKHWYTSLSYLGRYACHSGVELVIEAAREYHSLSKITVPGNKMYSIFSCVIQKINSSFPCPIWFVYLYMIIYHNVPFTSDEDNNKPSPASLIYPTVRYIIDFKGPKGSQSFIVTDKLNYHLLHSPWW